MQNELESLVRWQAAGHKVALAVVLDTWGSAPRQSGSLMAVRGDGTFQGSVSGGCVEGAVIAEAMALIKVGGTKRLTYKVSKDDAISYGLACGGSIEVAVLPVSPKDQAAVIAALEALATRRRGTLGLDLAAGRVSFGPATVEDRATAPTVDGDFVTLPVNPKPRLDIVGAVHIAQALSSMASECGYDVTVIDPRATFIERREFDGAQTVEDWPDDYFRRTPPDGETAVVLLTHDPKLDDAALGQVLNSQAFYIGALGSRKTQATRLARLEKAGFGADALARIHGPVGLAIGAVTPQEIAVSILAQMTATLRKAG